MSLGCLPRANLCLEPVRHGLMLVHKQMAKVFDAFCQKLDISSSSVRFIFDGLPVKR